MYTYFSRFLHHTLSHSDVKQQSTSMLSPSGLTRWSRSNQVANLPHLDTPIKSECDSYCAGRSMVEMLGVLAIIGVLSVGAISGYSKAMMKYKLNKQAEQLNTVFNAVDRHLYSFSNLKVESGTGISITSYFIKMGEIPTEMVKDNQYIYDTFNTSIRISKEYYTPTTVYGLYMSPSLASRSNDNIAVCQNIITVAKEHADSLYSLETYGDNDSGHIRTLYFGDKYCGTNSCIRNISLDDIYKLCTQHIGNSGTGFTIQWHV